MSRIMTIWLPRWPVQRRLLERPELRKVPVFVCRRERRGVMTVVAWAWAAPPRAAEPSASRLGGAPLTRIPAGVSLAEAMAVLSLAYGSRACHVAEVDHDDPVADRIALEEVARYCRRFAPLVAIEDAAMGGHRGPHRLREPECLQLDVTGTAGFFGGEGPLVRTVVWTLASRGIHVRAAIADTPAAAWAAAHHTDRLHSAAAAVRPQPLARPLARRHGRWAIVPAGTQMLVLAGLPATALRLDAAVLAQLGDVGIETIGDISRLPRKSLASRFPPQLADRLAEFTGERAEPLVIPCSGELPAASHAFDFPLLIRDTTMDDLVATIGPLVRECVVPLAALGKGVMSLQVRLQRSPAGEPREACLPAIIDVGVFQPSSSPQHLLELVQLRMARMRLPREIEGIAVEVISVGTVLCRQRTLFGEGAETSASQVGMLFDRLSGRLGRGAVFEPRPVADAQPEHAWVAVPPVATSLSASTVPVATGRRGRTEQPQGQQSQSVGRRIGTLVGDATASCRRPIWMLPQPVRLENVLVVPAEQPESLRLPPARFRIGTQSYEIVKAYGPERIETAWWRGPTVRRDYYVVETSTGGRYWIFRRLRGASVGRLGGEWFLHGTFS
ncbi:MAG: hypothetical protein HQ464_14600 [Planctomycetes bacterium]|nr:hypothetical protein [Planctomycetota bacterium]